MKKILFLSTALLAALTACDDYNDQFHLDSPISDIKNGTAIQLAASDYASIANNEKNKEIALSKDPENQAYVKALEAIGENRYFANKTEAEWFLPAFITERYPEADAGSRFVVSYNMRREPSGYMADFRNLSEYTLSTSDYVDAWGDRGSATYLTPSTVNALPDVLGKKVENPQEGDMVAVNYAYSEFEPGSGGGVIPVVYQQTDEIDPDVMNYVIAAKGGDGKYYPFGKLGSEDKESGYMYPDPIEVDANGVISMDEGASQVITLEATENGYALKNTWGQYLYMNDNANYNGFYVSSSMPSDAGEWSFSGDGVLTLKNVARDKVVQLNLYKDSYSFGCYPTSKYVYWKDEMKEPSTQFTIKDVTLPEGSDYVWKHDSYGYYKASAFVNKVNYPSESWMVSNEIDLSDASAPLFTFDFAFNFLNGNNAADFMRVKVSADYAGDINTATWTDVQYNGSAFDGWNFVAQSIDLASFAGKKITLAFVYKSTDKCAPTAEIKNLVIKNGNYYDVSLFKEVAESEAGEALLRASRASGSNANTSALYVYKEGKWMAYTADVKSLVVNPRMYAEMGADYVQKPTVMLPVLLAKEFPYAAKGEQVVVVYKKAADAAPMAEEYAFTAGWTPLGNSAIASTIFVKQPDATYSAEAGTYLDETLLGGSDGGFTVQDIKLTGGMNFVWKIDATYGWKASAFFNKVNCESESWLVSPEVDLTSAMAPKMTFEVALNFLNGRKPSEHTKIKISTDYVDNVETCQWTDLEYDETQWPDGSNWDFSLVGPYDLSAYKGQIIRIAIVYLSSSEAAPTLELKNIKVNEAE